MKNITYKTKDDMIQNLKIDINNQKKQIVIVGNNKSELKKITKQSNFVEITSTSCSPTAYMQDFDCIYWFSEQYNTRKSVENYARAKYILTLEDGEFHCLDSFDESMFCEDPMNVFRVLLKNDGGLND